MDNQEKIKELMKELTTSDNASKITEAIESLQEDYARLTKLEAENKSLRDKIVEMAFKSPSVNIDSQKENEQSIEPEIEEQVSIDMAINEWCKEHL